MACVNGDMAPTVFFNSDGMEDLVFNNIINIGISAGKFPCIELEDTWIQMLIGERKAHGKQINAARVTRLSLCATYSELLPLFKTKGGSTIKFVRKCQWAARIRVDANCTNAARSTRKMVQWGGASAKVIDRANRGRISRSWR